MTELDQQQREQRLRRKAYRHELQLVKSRCRTPTAPAYGGYMLVDPMTNLIILGGGGDLAYSLDLDDVEEYLSA